MADNVTVGGVVYATEDVGGVQAQIVKPAWGGDGVATVVTPTTAFPVNIAGSAGGGAAVTGTLTAAGTATLAGTAGTTSTVVIDVSAAGNASFHLLATAFVGTVVFEQSFDPAGTAGTWAAVPCIPEDATSAPMSTLAISTAAAYVRQFTQGMFGPALFRVRCSAFTSGSLTVYAKAGPGWVEGQPALAPSAATIGAVLVAPPSTFTLTTVTTSTTAGGAAVSGLAADTNRKGVTIFNDHASGSLCVALGATATATIYNVEVPPQGYYEVPRDFVTAAVSLFSATASVPARIGTAV